MKFLNHNTFYSENQRKNIEKTLSDIRSGKYNKLVNKFLNDNFTVLDIGFRSGYLSYQASINNKGHIYGVDLGSGTNPSAKETFKFNNLQGTFLEFDNLNALIQETKRIIASEKIDVVFNRYRGNTIEILGLDTGISLPTNIAFFHLDKEEYVYVDDKNILKLKNQLTHAKQSTLRRSYTEPEVVAQHNEVVESKENVVEEKVVEENVVEEKVESTTKKSTRSRRKTKTSE